MDKKFLTQRTLPYLQDICRFLESVAEFNGNAERKLPLSSTPEYNDNSINAWFTGWTSYDLSLVRNAFEMLETAYLNVKKRKRSKILVKTMVNVT